MAIPGGLIPSGIGGCIQVGELGDDLADLEIRPGGEGVYDVSNWMLEKLFITAECTHSGTMGAITRRRVAYDFRFSVSAPYDYENPPDELLAGAQTIALRLNIGNVRQDPELYAEDVEQKFYVAPSAFLEHARPVLDATGRDVVRIQCSGSGNGLIYLLPDDRNAYQQYLAYLDGRGWLT